MCGVNLKLIIIIIIIAGVIIAGAIYLVSVIKRSDVLNTTGSVTPPSQQNSNIQLSPNTVADTTTNISNDLNQIPNDSSLNNYTDFLNESLQNF